MTVPKRHEKQYDCDSHNDMGDSRHAGYSGGGPGGELYLQRLGDAPGKEHGNHKRQTSIVQQHKGLELLLPGQVRYGAETRDYQENSHSKHKHMRVGKGEGCFSGKAG